MTGWNISHYFLNLDVFSCFAVGSCAASSSDWFILFSACILVGCLSNFTTIKGEKFPKTKQSTLKLRLLLSPFTPVQKLKIGGGGGGGLP